MAITKLGFKDSRSNGEFSLSDGGSDSQTPSSVSLSLDYDNASDFNDGDDEEGVDDSGAELGDAEIGAEFCLVENWICSVPYELYDLPDLKGVLSLDAWNNCLSDEDRFGLAEFLPDMDQEAYGYTLKDLFEGRNFHFVSPLADLFRRLKGGLCRPRVALYQQALNFFGRHCHYYLLRKYQNSMVRSLFQVRDALEKSWNCGIEEKLRILQEVRSHGALMHEKDRRLGSGTDSSAREEIDKGFWAKNVKANHGAKKVKTNHGALYTVRPSSDGLPQGASSTVGPSRCGKQSRKGILQVATLKDYSKKDHVGANVNDVRMKFSPSVKFSVMDTCAAVPQGKYDSFSKYTDHVGLAKEENESRASYMSPLSKENLDSNHGNQNAKWMMHDETSTEKLRRNDYPSKDSRPTQKLWNSLGENGMKPLRHKHQLVFSKESRANWLVGVQSRLALQDDLVSTDDNLQFESNLGSKKQKTRGEFQSVRKELVKSSGKILHQVDQTNKTSTELYRRIHSRNVLMHKQEHKGISMSGYDEETESDSSEEADGDDDVNPSGYVSGTFGGGQSASVGRPADLQNASRLMWRDKREYSQHIHGFTKTSRRIIDLGGHAYVPKAKISPPKRSKGGNSFNPCYSNVHLEGKRNKKSVQDGKIHDDNCGISDPVSGNTCSADKKQKGKGKINPDNSFPLSDYIDRYAHEVLDGGNLPDVNGQSQTHKSWKKDAKTYLTEADGQERSSLQLLGCSSKMRKQKGKADAKHLDGSDMYSHLQSVLEQPIDDPTSVKKNGKKKLDTESAPSTAVTSDSIVSEREMLDRDMDAKLPKKPFTLITPSVHTGFSFSIIHLLSAVRRAMIMSHMDDTGEVDRVLVKNKMAKFPADESLDVNDSDCTASKNMPSLTVQEILNCVRSNPGDPCILETQEPLQDLVRGALKIFSSKTAPLGAKAWKPLVFYDKSTKNWSWVGPVSSSSLEGDTIVEETSSDAWGVPHKMLVKLVDAFANWLKSGEETLKQIGSLPPPPPMFSSLDERERFKDLRAQKSLATISPSSDEMREYFRREEVLRYSIPDRAFSYTATDGRKSIVAPLRRSGGKAREHFILKPDRPPHVTILCLVRDAAARLPGSIGTRADVCTLIRDSQYIVENISDTQLNQIVSGALDRLHYERDPCVQFDAERKLWVYLHRDREEEDLEDDGTSSTKKWKRPRKGSACNPGAGTINDVGLEGAGDQVGGSLAVRSELYAESSSIAAQQTEAADLDLQEDLEESIGQFIDAAQNSIVHPMGWEVLDLNAIRENKIVCQKNFKNEDFDDDNSEGKSQQGMIVQSSIQGMDVT